MKLIDIIARDILFPWIVWRGNRNRPVVHLTFDDGPHPEYTPRLLDLLAEADMKGTFFVLGEKAIRHPGLVLRIHREGHGVASHGFSHVSLAFRNKKTVFREIEAADQAIASITGSQPLFFRPPYGRFDPRFKRWMAQTGHRLVLWNCLSRDYAFQDPKRLQARILGSLSAGDVILMHDGHPNSPVLIAALPGILSSIKEMGFHSEVIDDA